MVDGVRQDGRRRRGAFDGRVGALPLLTSSSSARLLLLQVELVELGCPLFACSPSPGTDAANLFWTLDRALAFSSTVTAPAERILAYLQKQPGGGLTALHARVEADWKKHCLTWRGAGNEGYAYSNCNTNADALLEFLRFERIDRAGPLYVAGGYTYAAMKAIPGLAPLLANSSFTVVTKDLAEPDIFRQWGMVRHREILAAVDFIVCRKVG